MNEATKQIVIAVAAASAAALVTGLITHYFTKESTVASVAKGTTPLPSGSTPTTTSKETIVVTPAPSGTTKTPTDTTKNQPLNPKLPNQNPDQTVVDLSQIVQSMPRIFFQNTETM